MSNSSLKVNIIGGGPGGLFLAILLRQHRPEWSVRVWERNPPHATFGFGVVFSDRTVELLDRADPILLERIGADFQSWTDIEIGTWQGVRRTSGHGFSAIARHRLLAHLQQRARELDVPVSYGHEALNFDELYVDSDLLVGADGINSLVRQHWAAEFRPDVRLGRARFIWFATPRRYDALTFHFVDTPYGPFSTHAYPFSEDLSTFIVEVDVDTWQRAGLDPTDRPAMGVGETDNFARAFCEEVFRESLQGHDLVGNASQWRQFATVRNASWRAADKVVILGDAAHTAHFSVGSGTKMAMEDAAALAKALCEFDEPGHALTEYESLRMASVTKIQQLAEPSRGWWENFQYWVDRDIDAVSVNFLTRTGRETVGHLTDRDPHFASQCVRHAALDSGMQLSADVHLPHRRGLHLPNDPVDRLRVLTVCAAQPTRPSFVVLCNPQVGDIEEVRSAFGAQGPVVVADATSNPSSSWPTGADLVVVRPGQVLPVGPFAVRVLTPAAIDDEQGWLRLVDEAIDAESAGATAVCVQADSSEHDRRALVAHAGVVLRPKLSIPIIVWDCSSEQEALTHLNSDRAELVAGFASADYFQAIYAALGLESLLAPKSVVVVGASQSPRKAGYALMSNLTGFSGRVYGLGRTEGDVHGRRIVTDMAELEEMIDLAILAVPSQAVPSALETLGKHGVRAAIVCSGGFAETASAEGRALQEEINRVRERHGMRILGPNTSGMSIPPVALHASFVPAVSRLTAGDVAVVAQSGGVAHATALALNAEGIGVGTMIGTGNASDVDLPELITAIAARGQHSCISVHLEGTSQGERLLKAVESASRKVPVIVLKSGVSDVDRLASSHTGALTGDWQMAQALLTEAGAVVVSTLGDLIDSVAALSKTRLEPSDKPNAAGVVTGQAGPGILLTDRLQTLGINVPPLSTESAERLEALLPDLTHRQNPVDTGRPGANFAEVLNIVGQDPNVDAVAVYALLEPGAVDLDASLEAAARHIAVPIVASTNGLTDEVERARAGLSCSGIPLYVNPERAARGVWALFEDRRSSLLRERGPLDVAQDPCRVSPAVPATEAEAKNFLREVGVVVPESRVCLNRDSAHEAFVELSAGGHLVVAKVLSSELAHKATVGGVHIGVDSAASLDAALDLIDVIERSDRGYLIEQQVEPGLDLFLAVRQDPSWGAVGLIGLGGGDVETRGEVHLFSYRNSSARLNDLLTTLAPQASHHALQLNAIMHKMHSALEVWTEAHSFEINPLRITPAGIVAIDALVDRT